MGESKLENVKVVLIDSHNVNSYGFKIDLDGLDLKRFKKNPVMLLQHNPDNLIGRWEDLAITDNKLTANAVFDSDDELAVKTAGKVKRGFLKGCSVGIIVQEIKHNNNYDVVTKSELLEASFVTIPADSSAVVLYDEQRNRLTFEQLKLQFYNDDKIKKMDKTEEKKQDVTLDAKDKEISTLKARVEELENSLNKANDAAIDSMLESAVRLGKINDKEKESYKMLAQKDYDTVKNLLDNKAVDKKPSLSAMVNNPTTLSTAGREDWTYIDWMKKDSEGLKRLKAENPSEFERLKETLN